jgi:hypothetical protein
MKIININNREKKKGKERRKKITDLFYLVCDYFNVSLFSCTHLMEYQDVNANIRRTGMVWKSLLKYSITTI